MKKEVIHIEICRSEYLKDKFNLRIGDIKGSSESCGFSKEDILKEISDEIDKLEIGDNSGNELGGLE